MRRKRTLLWAGSALLLLLVCGLIDSLPAPRNPLWHLFDGTYRYDPRVESPPSGLLLDRPEDALQHFLAATLTLCDQRYPPVSPEQVQRYEVEAVEYLGKTSYHAFSHVHTRLFYAEGRSVRVTFRLEAGHNEGELWYLDQGSTVRAGAWSPQGGLLPSPEDLPPDWPSLTCADLGAPFAIGA